MVASQESPSCSVKFERARSCYPQQRCKHVKLDINLLFMFLLLESVEVKIKILNGCVLFSVVFMMVLQLVHHRLQSHVTSKVWSTTLLLRINFSYLSWLRSSRWQWESDQRWLYLWRDSCTTQTHSLQRSCHYHLLIRNWTEINYHFNSIICIIKHSKLARFLPTTKTISFDMF